MALKHHTMYPKKYHNLPIRSTLTNKSALINECQIFLIIYNRSTQLKHIQLPTKQNCNTKAPFSDLVSVTSTRANIVRIGFLDCYVLSLFGSGRFCPYSSGLLHWHWGNHRIAPVPVKQPWRIWVDKSDEYMGKHDTCTTKTMQKKKWCMFCTC